MSAGNLHVSVANTLWATSTNSSVELTFNFSLVNDASATCLGGGCSGQGPFHQTIAVYGAAIISETVMNGRAMVVADFSDLEIQQSTTAAGAISIIMLTFSTRVSLDAGTVITLDGLRGFCSYVPTIDLIDAVPFSTRGLFDAVSGKKIEYSEFPLFR
jgi:hypothetical protein